VKFRYLYWGGEMEDLERLARHLHDAPEWSKRGAILDNGFPVWFKNYRTVGINISIEEIQAKRDELSGKPKEWSFDWAQWRGQDEKGVWLEYACDPRQDGPNRKHVVFKGQVLGDWRDTLEKRVMEDKQDCCCDETGPCKMHAEQLIYWPCKHEYFPGYIKYTGKKYVIAEINTGHGDNNGREIHIRKSALKTKLGKTPKEKAIEEMKSLIDSWQSRGNNGTLLLATEMYEAHCRIQESGDV